MSTLVLADLHLAPEGTRGASTDLARLVQRHAGDEILLAGDSFDLSVDPAGSDPARASRSAASSRAFQPLLLRRSARAKAGPAAISVNSASVRLPSSATGPG